MRKLVINLLIEILEKGFLLDTIGLYYHGLTSENEGAPTLSHAAEELVALIRYADEEFYLRQEDRIKFIKPRLPQIRQWLETLNDRALFETYVFTCEDMKR